MTATLAVCFCVGSLEGVGRMAEGCADSDARFVRQDGWTPLHVASLKGRVEVVAALLAKGADVKAKDKVSISQRRRI